jgi:hypothetical protein
VRRFHCGIDLRQRQSGMVEKGLACGVNSMPCTLRLINWTPTWYSRSRIWRLSEGCAVCSLLSREGEAALLGDRDGIAKAH